jgi:hypothetical protein
MTGRTFGRADGHSVEVLDFPDAGACEAWLPAFERLGRSNRYAVILPLLRARTPQARAKALARAVAWLADRS